MTASSNPGLMKALAVHCLVETFSLFTTLHKCQAKAVPLLFVIHQAMRLRPNKSMKWEDKVVDPDQPTVLDLLRMLDYPNEYVPIVAEPAPANVVRSTATIPLSVINKAMLSSPGTV